VSHTYTLLGSEQCTGQAEARDSSRIQAAPRTCAIRPVWPSIVEKADSSSHYDHRLLPTLDHKIQCNRTAGSELEHHHIEWHWTDAIDPHSNEGQDLETVGRGSATGDGTFIRNLRVGDMVTVWGRARFPGWRNIVQKVQVRVYWAL
jgi:hypothetical protein